MRVVNLGLIGAGRIGRMHADNAAKRLAGSRVISVADVNLDAAQATARSIGAERVFREPRRVLEDPDVEAVLICSATDTHAELIEASAAAKKHIFCEKPIALALDPIDRALAKVEEAGVKLQIGFNRRFDPGFARVRRAVADGDIGELHIVRITSRDPAAPPLGYVRVSGGLFLDMTIHDLDMARFVAGSEIRAVFAAGAARVDPAIGEVGDIDTAVVTLTFENGVFATIDNSRKATYGYDQRLEAFGSRGMIWADNHPEALVGAASERGFQAPRLRDFFIERYTEAYLVELQAFIDCVRLDRAPPVTGKDGRAPVIAALAAQVSLRERREVLTSEIG